MQVVGMGALRGIKDANFAFKATMFVFWGLGATTVFISYYYFEKSPEGIWVGLLVGLGGAAIVHHLRMYYKTKIPD